MAAITAGHLSNNGGVRGHSAGEFFPYRVMPQGKIDSLRYWVISPEGFKLMSWANSTAACEMARLLHSIH